jgi:hypothetical protein
MNMNLSEQKNLTLFKVLGLLGILPCALTLFTRETSVAENSGVNFRLNIMFTSLFLSSEIDLFLPGGDESLKGI